MKPIIKVIDSVLVKKGNKTLSYLEEASHQPQKTNDDVLMQLLQDNKDTEYGKKYGFADIKSVEDFKKKVPFSDYDDYYPYIERMIKNKESNLITAYNVIQYAETSGSVGAQKKNSGYG